MSRLLFVLVIFGCSSPHINADECRPLCAPHAVCSYAGGSTPEGTCICADDEGRCPGATAATGIADAGGDR